MKNMYRKILSELKNGNGAALSSVYFTLGSTPRGAGAKMAYFADGSTLGTVGGGAIEHDCITVCSKLNSTTKPFTKDYNLTHADASDLGMVCGGNMYIHFVYITPTKHNIAVFEHINALLEENKKSWLITLMNTGELGTYEPDNGYSFIEPESYWETDSIFKTTVIYDAYDEFFTEPLTHSGTVYVFGCGHISQALSPLLSSTDFRHVVYDNNEKFATPDLFPYAQKVICADFFCINDHVDITHDDYVVVLTRGHHSDNEVIAQLLSKHPSYIGVIGSKKKVAVMRDYLKAHSYTQEEINSIHSPIGLSIGAVTPEEIAVSIVAQLISHRAEQR